MDIIIDGNIQPSDGFMIGATTSQILDLTLLNKGDMVYGTSTIKVEIGLKIGNTIEYIPMGIYNIDDIEKTDYTIKITAFDNMMKFERNFTTTLGDTLTLQQVASELTRITGVQFTGNLPAYTVKKLEGFSCREVLGYVASVCGGNAIITRDGKFTIVTPKDNSYSIGTSNYFEYKREETKYKIGKISCQAGEEVLSKGSLGADSMELEFENPWVTNSILQDIYNKLNGFEYLGYSMKWQGDPSIDVGDIVTITDKKGVVRKHPILSQKFTYTGGLTSEISAKGENKNKNEFSGSGPSAKKVERVVMELALINKALIDVAYIGDLTAGNIKFDTASGTIMDLQTLLAKFVTGENGQFLNLTTDNVTISNALIKDVIAKSISVEDLKASTISTNKFRITSDNGGIEIVGATQQFKDKNNKVRIQMGQDTQGNFNFILRGEDGTTTLIDHTGIKEKAISDELIKSNMVAENAIGEKQINYSSLVTGLNKDTNTSLIQASKVAIDLTGQSLEVAFNSLKSNVDNMEVGGRNLQRNADFNKPLSGTWRYDAQFMSINEEILCDGYKSVKILRTNATTTSTRYLYTGGGVIPAKYGEEFTMSFMYYIPEDVSQEIDGTFQAGVWFYKDGNAGAGSTRKNLENEIVKGKWIKVVVTGKAKDVYTKSVAFVIGFDKNCEVYISKPKLERGNKATDFTVAPEDVEEKIESNTTAITVAQGQISGLISENTIIKGDITTISNKYTSLKATVDGINTTVASHTSSIGNLTTDLSGVSGKVATVENKQASLEQNLNGFKTTVASTYSTKTELSTVDGKVTGLTSRVSTAESSITQLNNSIDLSVSNLKKIVQEGNNNLVSNSNWFKGPSGWRLSTTLAGNYFYGVSGSMVLEDKHYIRLGHSNNNETNIIYADSSKFPVSPGEKITYGAFGAATSNVRFRIYLLFTSNIDDINTDNSFMPGYTFILYEGNAAYTKKNLTVTVPDGAIRAFIRVRIDKIDTSINTNSSGVFSSLMVRKGEEVFEWCPSQGDSYTYIDEQTANLQVNINDITSRVSSTESSISTINGNVSALQSRMSSAEQKITSSAIINTVRSSTAYTNDLNAKANQSALNTTNSNISNLTTRVNSVEQNITATAITTTISSAITGGTGSISTTQFVMDKNGLLIKNGAFTIQNKAGTKVFYTDTSGNITFTGKLQPSDYQIRLFGENCKIDGSAGAIRMQWNAQNYVSVENGALRMYNSNSAGGTRYISFATDTEGHANIWGTQTRMKLLGNSSARPVIQSRNISDNAYGDFHGADFLNRSTIKDKTNVEIIEDLDFSKILLENNIFKYNLKTDVENLLKKFGLYEECNLDEVVDSSTDIRLGFILEELTEDARLLLCPGNMESISIYSMCSIMWKMCQQYQKRIEVLEEAVKLFRCFHGGVYEET
ncbi:hypothetical protein [Clostridium tertium]|nr:hypothetical protein [Clostridium tertium]